MWVSGPVAPSEKGEGADGGGRKKGQDLHELRDNGVSCSVSAVARRPNLRCPVESPRCGDKLLSHAGQTFVIVALSRPVFLDMFFVFETPAQRVWRL